MAKYKNNTYNMVCHWQPETKPMELRTAAFLLLILVACRTPSKVEWISTTPDKPWVQKSSNAVDDFVSNDAIVIDTKNVRQQIAGLGGCFNEMGWEALKYISESDRTIVIKSLFDTLTGCKFNICRLPLGANDYSLDWYSYNETPGDFSMEKFSTAHDKQLLIPYIKAAQQYNPNLYLWASPWSPPSWMKVNNHYACYSTATNGLPKSGQGEEMKDQFIVEDKYFAAYVLYFEKFIKEYGKEGITISAVQPQNEMNSCQGFPSCIWKPSTMAKFIGQYLGPHMEANTPSTELWLGTIERPQLERIDTILSDPLAKKYINGVGFQWGGKDAIQKVREKFSRLGLMQTETECGDGSNDWKAAEHTFELMRHYFNNGANSYMYWNMVLDETGKSRWGWKQNSMISIDTQQHTVRYNPEFYLMKHFSAYLKPGAVRLALKDESVPCLAFKENDQKVVIIYYNQGNARNVTFAINSENFTLRLEPNSFNTFVAETRNK